MNRKYFYPVIHCVPTSQGGIDHAIENAHLAWNNGADGVFLIGHRMDAAHLRVIYMAVRKQFPQLWIGINFLDIPVNQKHHLLLIYIEEECRGLNALWCDELPNVQLPRWLQVFGGVAFKYINPDQSGLELATTCEKAVHTVNVATTSGDKTGSPPSVEKLQDIKKLLADRIPLAVASGVEASNVGPMLPYVDIFLVASSLIERDEARGGKEYLVPEKVRELADLIHV